MICLFCYDCQVIRASAWPRWQPGILNGDGLGPTGMHWRTFARRQREHNAHINAALASLAARLRQLRDKFGVTDIDIDPEDWRGR